ncbi:hypothetical protein HNR03_006338, partial [Pseudomonas sp. JAI111]|nr:hypothetical protein [Pseudomonas sp. JAI111]
AVFEKQVVSVGESIHKGETLSRRYRSNGYVHPKETGRLSGRHREQAHSHSWTGYTRKSMVGPKAATAYSSPSGTTLF